MGRKGEAGGGNVHKMCSLFDGCCRGFGEVLGGNELGCAHLMDVAVDLEW